jgi:hypothetical protein
MSDKKSVKRKREEEAPGGGLRCIIHYPDLVLINCNVTPLSNQSYSTILCCKDTRCELGGLNVHADQCASIPIPVFDPCIHGYHRQCYQKFTKAKSIESRADTDSSTGDCSSHPHRLSRTQVTSSQTLFPKSCGLCEKDVIKVKGKKQYPTAIVTKSAEDTLRKAAEMHDDHVILTKIKAEDLIAR